MMGYIVVRLPKNSRKVIHGNVGEVVIVDNLSLGNKVYRGADRYAWEDLFDEDFYKGRLPDSLKDAVEMLENNFNQNLGKEVCISKDVAQKFLKYMNRSELKNEVISISDFVSPHHDDLVDVPIGRQGNNKDIEWIGYDYYAAGEWSLIKYGIFSKPEEFPIWVDKLNQHGLFDTDEYLNAYAAAYRMAAERSVVEPADGDGSGMSVVALRVGLLGG